ncbi:MAG: 16S rRNA (cytosine(967)-C(5))-methyltransferase RsmB [Kiritimatiellia bacterium]|nr:16S rRNA (cytosine(967)-C(5))-methyltransferase RsmB [Kiritimatiellia bacterium]
MQRTVQSKARNEELPPDAPARVAALHILLRWLADGDFPDRSLRTVVRDRPLVTEMVLGAVRRYAQLMWALEERCKRRPEPEIVAAFLVGANELLFLDNVKAHAAVFETVEAVKPLVHPEATAFLNALLRRISVERDSILQALPRQPDPIRLSHPYFLIRRWNALFGETKMRRLCEWNNGRPDLCLHPSRLRTDLRTYQRRLADHGITSTPHPFAPEAFLILGPETPPVERLPGFEEGAFTIQDPATSISVDLLNPKPGERLLDACASPGGKTALIAERMEGRGELISMDLHEDRMVRLRENIARLGLQGVRPVKADASRLTLPRLRELNLPADGFDGILLDVPCSNTGVIRRRPDARWRVNAELLARLQRAQEGLLQAAAGLLKPGGRIVYSTCSLETEENEGRVGNWVSKNPEFRKEQAQKTFPPDTGCDGAYAARIRRTGPA